MLEKLIEKFSAESKDLELPLEKKLEAYLLSEEVAQEIRRCLGRASVEGHSIGEVELGGRDVYKLFYDVFSEQNGAFKESLLEAVEVITRKVYPNFSGLVVEVDCVDMDPYNAFMGSYKYQTIIRVGLTKGGRKLLCGDGTEVSPKIKTATVVL